MLIIGLIIRGGDSFGHSIQSVTRGDIQVPDWLLPYLISTFVVPLPLSSLGLLFFCLLFPLNSQLSSTLYPSQMGRFKWVWPRFTLDSGKKFIGLKEFVIPTSFI